jgi:hypothetical protein
LSWQISARGSDSREELQHNLACEIDSHANMPFKVTTCFSLEIIVPTYEIDRGIFYISCFFYDENKLISIKFQCLLPSDREDH